MFPWGQASSRRVYGISRVLVDSGFKVIVGAGQWGPTGRFSVDECDGIEYVHIGDMQRAGASVLSNIRNVFIESGKKTVEWLNSMPERPAYVFVYGAGTPLMLRLSRWCNANSVPIIADVVEWYDGSHMLGGRFGPFNANAKIAMHYYYGRCDGVISISSYLAEYFSNRGSEVLRIPPVLDVLAVKMGRRNGLVNSRRIRLVYAGSPGKKDLLGTVIRGIQALGELSNRFELEVLGPSRAEIVNLLSGAAVPSFVKVLGKLSQEHVGDRLQWADFSVLLRKPERFANAGFPTKFVESLANGTPVIANITSDLAMYFHDGKEGVVCPDHSIQSFVAALRRVVVLSPREMEKMRHSARETAYKHFDYQKYSKALSAFLDGVGG